MLLIIYNLQDTNIQPEKCCNNQKTLNMKAI